MVFDRNKTAEILTALAGRGVYVGTSSWKYDGWCGQLYDPQRYVYRNKFATTRFEKNCLEEYASVFKTVCVDAAYYNFPSVKYLEGLAAQVPADFQFGFKVTDAVTIKRFPNLPRFGTRAGQKNEHFLNPDIFAAGFLKPCESIRSHVGILMFEFSRFHAPDYEHGKDFVSDLDQFFSALPSGWPYAVEMRNRQWLRPEYFECLARHQVAHVFNSWTEMPTVTEQMAMLGSGTTPSLSAARFLLRPGRRYEEAVKAFQPYKETKEVNDEARKAAALLIKIRKQKKVGRTYIFVNNRLEGNALNTIAAMLDFSDSSQAPVTENETTLNEPKIASAPDRNSSKS